MQLYFGLLLFIGFIVVDTQDIIEKAHLGDADYVNHAMLLFTDFIAVFVRVLVIMVSQATMQWNSFFLLWTLAVLITAFVCCLCIFMWNLHGSICCAVEEFHWEGWEEEEKEGLRVYVRSSSRTSDASWNLGLLMWNLVHKYAFFLNWTKWLLSVNTSEYVLTG